MQNWGQVIIDWIKYKLSTCLSSHHPHDNLGVAKTRRPGVRQREVQSSSKSSVNISVYYQNNESTDMPVNVNEVPAYIMNTLYESNLH